MLAKGTIVSKTAIKREKGFLYFLDKAGNVRRVRMKGKGKKKTAPRRR